jgi:pimeloyl-ACP methyl ester carboxylesterase
MSSSAIHGRPCAASELAERKPEIARRADRADGDDQQRAAPLRGRPRPRSVDGDRFGGCRMERPTAPARVVPPDFLTGCAERYGTNCGVGARARLQPRHPSWGWLDAAYRSCALLTDAALAKVEVPVLFVATAKDRLVSAREIRRAAAAMPQAELLMFEDAAHEILRETDAVRLEAFARIDRFLEERAKR